MQGQWDQAAQPYVTNLSRVLSPLLGRQKAARGSQMRGRRSAVQAVMQGARCWLEGCMSTGAPCSTHLVSLTHYLNSHYGTVNL